jgi:alkanesulfonate monooxygenase SsuD/methylene tetrahydromethanopterin reductase-like flavin-dependent oxidoreductase (luciferase family)
VGTDFDAIVRSANYNVIIGETEKDVQDRLGWLRAKLRKSLSADAVERALEQYVNGPLFGTPEQIAERLTQLRKLGMTYAITYFPEAAYDKSGIELFSRQVAPELA